MERRTFLVNLAGGLLAPTAARAQSGGRDHRMGFLRNGPLPDTFIQGFRQGLREVGYTEGHGIALDFGLAATADQLPAVAADLVRRRVDVIVASGPPPVAAAKNATSPASRGRAET